MAPSSSPWVLGLSFSHNGAACLMHGDQVVVSIQEERLMRMKRAWINARRPCLSVRYCLDVAGITASDLAMVVSSTTDLDAASADPAWMEELRERGSHVPVLKVSHHKAHALSAFGASGFRRAAVLVVDGRGGRTADFSDDEVRTTRGPVEDSWETLSMYEADGTSLTAIEKHVVPTSMWREIRAPGRRMPRFLSLGSLFNSVAQLVFHEFEEAGKVMGLAPYGSPTIPHGEFFSIEDGVLSFNERFVERFQYERPWPAHSSEYADLAASAQAALEHGLLAIVHRLRTLCTAEAFCYAGGVALNSVANERIIRESGYRDVFIPPAAEDSGGAMGAAYYGLWQLTGVNNCRRLGHDSPGRIYPSDEIDLAVKQTPAVTQKATTDVVGDAARMLADGKIIGFFQGGSEFGPRALGQRSILCDPRRADAKKILNESVKHREAFRPFAPVLPLENAREWFEIDEDVPAESPFMLRVAKFRASKRDLVPGVVHIDGTGRLQTLTRDANGRFYDLVKAFESLTGVPVLLNTSFNVMGEPIVETPEDALWCLLWTGLDYCVFEDRIVGKEGGVDEIMRLYPFVTAHQCRLSLPIRGGRLSTVPDPGPYVVDLTVLSRWGPVDYKCGAKTLSTLELLDGTRTAEEVFSALHAEEASAADRFQFVQLLATLRRSGVVSFSATARES